MRSKNGRGGGGRGGLHARWAEELSKRLPLKDGRGAVTAKMVENKIGQMKKQALAAET